MSTASKPEPTFDATIGKFSQPVLPILDPPRFETVHTSIEAAFSVGHLESFLKSVEKNSLRIRSFEEVLSTGLLGSSVSMNYGKLDGGDQGQLREIYLRHVEKVPAELRRKYTRLYSYY